MMNFFESVQTPHTGDSSSSACMFLCGRKSRYREKFIPSIPKSRFSADDARRYRAQVLEDLSPEEKEERFRDLQGIGTIVEETQEFVRRCKEEMDEVLNRIGRETAYEQALHMSPSYVQDEKLRLMFLRADNFKPHRAANRLVRWFEEKLSIFGPDKLTREIRLDDLDECEIAILESGCFHLPNVKDRMGRRLHVGIPHLEPRPHSIDNMKRAQFYQLMKLVADEATDKKQDNCNGNGWQYLSGILQFIYVTMTPPCTTLLVSLLL